MADSSLKRLGQLGSVTASTTGHWLMAAIDGADERRGPARTDAGWFHPSSLDHICDAYLAFSYLGVASEEVIPARLSRVFALGNARDLDLKKSVRRAGISLVEKERDRYIEIPEFKIRGSFDDHVAHPITKERYIVDFKTMRSDLWEALKEIMPAHHLQVHPYMFGVQTYKALLLYENKNTQEFKIKTGHFDNKIWHGITSRVLRILDDLDKGFVRRTPLPNDSQCPFYHMCSYANIPKLKEESGLF